MIAPIENEDESASDIPEAEDIKKEMGIGVGMGVGVGIGSRLQMVGTPLHVPFT